MKLMLLAFTAAFSHAAILDQLSSITNDRNADVSTLSVSFENNGKVNGFDFFTRHEDKSTDRLLFTPAQLATGAVLGGDATHKAIILRGTIDDKKGTGSFKLQYLSNGLSGTYKECSGIKLQRGADQKWALFNYQNKPLTQMKIVTWSLGITTIENACPPAASLATTPAEFIGTWKEVGYRCQGTTSFNPRESDSDKFFTFQNDTYFHRVELYRKDACTTLSSAGKANWDGGTLQPLTITPTPEVSTGCPYTGGGGIYDDFALSTTRLDVRLDSIGGVQYMILGGDPVYQDSSCTNNPVVERVYQRQ